MQPREINIRDQDARLARLTREFRKEGSRNRKRTFFCPILYTEEEAKLCRGHVVPKSIGGNQWVVQRSDVDNFFGSFAEARFGHGVKLRSLEKTEDAVEYVAKKKLGHMASPRIVDSKGNRRPIQLRSQDGNLLGRLVIDTSEDLYDLDNPVSVELCIDVAPETVLTSLHTIHLGIFRRMGYRYVDSLAGRFIGDFLGEIYRTFSSNRELRGDRQLLTEMCSPYVNMVRPIKNPERLNSSLLEDPFNWFLVCWHDSWPFGTIQFIKADNEVNAVMTFACFDECARALIDSRVAISFKATLGHMADDHSILAGPVKEETLVIAWTCGDGTIPMTIPIAQAVQFSNERFP